MRFKTLIYAVLCALLLCTFTVVDAQLHRMSGYDIDSLNVRAAARMRRLDIDSLNADTLKVGVLIPTAGSWKRITVDTLSASHRINMGDNKYIQWTHSTSDTVRLDNNGTSQLRVGFGGGAVGATIWADSMAVGLLHTTGAIRSDGAISFGQYSSAPKSLAAGGKGIQTYVTAGNDAVKGKTTSALYGRIHTVNQDSIGSQIGCYGRGVIDSLGRVSDNYGGFFVAEQKNASKNDFNLIGALGYAIVTNTDSTTSAQQWVSGLQGIVGGDGKIKNGVLRSGVISHVLYDPVNNGYASAYCAARNGSGAGGTAGAAVNIVQTSSLLHDWTYGISFPAKSSGYNFSRGEIGALDGLLNIDGLPVIPQGTIGTADTVIVSLNGTATKIVPTLGAMVIDTAGTDSLFVYFAGWVFLLTP